jgi:membrane protease YdiL (CAAX protease family)
MKIGEMNMKSNHIDISGSSPWHSNNKWPWRWSFAADVATAAQIVGDDKESKTNINWPEVKLFLAITFFLTFILDLILWKFVGYGSTQAAGILLQLQMLLPAFTAIGLSMFFFEKSRLKNMRKNAESFRWFFYYFLAYTILYALIGTVLIISQQTGISVMAAALSQVLTILGLLLLVALRLRYGEVAASLVGLGWGKHRYWELFGMGFIIFYLTQTGLNQIFSLGQSVNPVQFLSQILPDQTEQFLSMGPMALLLVTGVQTVLLSSFIAIPIAFGEEWGWRGYLQGELIKMGRVRGVLLLGFIWGLWHAPIILMGHNYPGHPVLGVFLMMAYTICLGFVLSYAVLKSGSIILVSFLHALNNQIQSFLMMLVYRPHDPVFSFGLGLYGIVCLAVIVLLIQNDKIWKIK